jgi:hypothetical protein
MSTIISWPSTPFSLYGLLYSPFSLYTMISEFSGRLRTSLLRGLFLVLIARLMLSFALLAFSIFIAFCTASALCMMSGDGGELALIRGYVLKTRSVSTSLFGPAISLRAFTTICRISSSSVLLLSSARSILNVRRRGLWACLIFLTA